MDIRLSRYKIHNGQNGGVKLELHVTEQAKMDLGVLSKTNIAGGVYTRCLLGYNILVL